MGLYGLDPSKSYRVMAGPAMVRGAVSRSKPKTDEASDLNNSLFEKISEAGTQDKSDDAKLFERLLSDARGNVASLRKNAEKIIVQGVPERLSDFSFGALAQKGVERLYQETASNGVEPVEDEENGASAEIKTALSNAAKEASSLSLLELNIGAAAAAGLKRLFASTKEPEIELHDVANKIRKPVYAPLDKLTAKADIASAQEKSEKQISLDNIHDIIVQAASDHGLDPALVKAVVKTESNFNHTAISSAGAMGLMQLMPGTARDLGVKDPFDPEQNVYAGAKYLKNMLDRYRGNVNRALAAYNWGPGNLERYGGKRMPRETRNYIKIVNQHYRSFKT